MVLALAAGSGGPRAVALHELIGVDASVGLDVVDVLRVVAEQPTFVLEELDELMRCRPLVQVRQDVSSQRVEGSDDIVSYELYIVFR